MRNLSTQDSWLACLLARSGCGCRVLLVIVYLYPAFHSTLLSSPQSSLQTIKPHHKIKKCNSLDHVIKPNIKSALKRVQDRSMQDLNKSPPVQIHLHQFTKISRDGARKVSLGKSCINVTTKTLLQTGVVCRPGVEKHCPKHDD